MEILPQFLLLLGLAVGAILLARKVHVPSTIAYLAVGVILGPFTVGPILDQAAIEEVAEYGIVFLLFTIGLSFSLPELKTLGRTLPLLGAAQVLITTGVVTLGAYVLGVPLIAAFVVGAVFAQSSSTIISKQLSEQGEENSASGRMGLGLSVFQDVTAVPFVIVIPVLAVAVSPDVIAGELGLALVKVAAAIVGVLALGHWGLRTLIRHVARRRSAELFTLTVLFVVLAASWGSELLGLSLAFGAFLAGMTLGETEFRHQVESTIRPFRDVLLGLFFIAIGMLFDPTALPSIWGWVVIGTLVLLLSKAIPVAILTYAWGFDRQTAVRTGLLLAVGGEFGFALIAIALTNNAIDSDVGQIALTSVLMSMVAGTFLIRYNAAIGRALAKVGPGPAEHDAQRALAIDVSSTTTLDGHVALCGYGRIGQSVAHFLDAEDIPYVAVDLDTERVRAARETSLPVFFADSSEPAIMEAMNVASARLVVIAHNDFSSAIKTLTYLQRLRPELPVLVRTRDDSQAEALQAAGAYEVVPETLEAGLSISSQVLGILGVDDNRISDLVREQRLHHYQLMREFFPSDDAGARVDLRQGIRPLEVPKGSAVVGITVDDLLRPDLALVAVLRNNTRLADAHEGVTLEEGDVVVAYGELEMLDAVERSLNSGARGSR